MSPMRKARAHIITARTATVALVCALALAALGPDEDELTDPAPAIALDPPAVPEPESVRCAECHLETAREWAETAHAIAWVDEHYREAIADRKRPELCASCHIPEPLLATGELPRQPQAREDALEPRDHGITCTSCHAGADGVVLGPHGKETPAHATAKSAFMTAERSPEMCALCHKTNIGPVVGIAKDYEGSAAAEAGTTCVDCHMRPVERRWANLPDGGEDPAVEPRIGRSHALQTPRDPGFLKRAFALEWSVADGKTKVVVKNRAGHRVPGLQGREMRFAFEALAAGAPVGSAELLLDTRSYLPVDGELSVAIDGAADAVRVKATHLDPRAGEPVVFLDGDVPPAE